MTDDLRNLSLEQLEILAQEIRQQILSACLKNGGHLGASLGTVELAIALHSVFHSPQEPIIWDVGHQAYAHKLLTGRWERFATLRKWQGISGFLSRDESEHDVFGAGHSSTALSAALGMAWARGRKEELKSHWTVAVVGDGGLTAGVAFEALNNVRATTLGPMLLVLNDNQMSISKNVGSMPSILASGDAAKFFELFGFDYIGPVDGHHTGNLIETLRTIRSTVPQRPVLLHVMTQKGKGYAPAEESPAIYHGISPVQEKVQDKPAEKAQSYSDAFGTAICKLAEEDPKIVAITAAMSEGTGLLEFARRFPDRFFDVGIAEPHAVIFAASLATQGYRPVVAIYSTFLQRGIDQAIHDVALQKLGVTFAIDRAGLVGADGPTHHGMFDIAYLGMVPGFHVTSPGCLSDVEDLLRIATRSGVPFAIRYPRGSGPKELSVSENRGVRFLNQVRAPIAVVVAFGSTVAKIDEALKLLTEPERELLQFVGVTFAKPLSLELIQYLKTHPDAEIITLEDGVVRGGFGEALRAEINGSCRLFTPLGYPDEFVPHGAPTILEKEIGFTPPQLAEKFRSLLRGKKSTGASKKA